ncbi:cytochrome oxidase assembly protein ShyY1 [Microbacterium terrae]|uniref:SURF1-like protein n=2 Tax=Microbacterium terrae TaxID=69369 RepID=A0A0M2H8J2_9MICO|nr:SURF1 family protein [Microbacterium terrae]MBP1078220.1 cytochrome oxidase assembly protein ShyY1 [Microbacterium terrae]GLJ97699.1 SURF1-like protein [Microbacterium terrae]
MTSIDPSTGSGTGSGAGAAADVPEVFPPTLREVMLRPQWIGLLLLCLVVAGVFAWLGQWQLGRAIDTDPPPAGITEELKPIDEIVQPGEYLSEPLVGQQVEVTGRFVPGDFLVVASRYNDDVEGYWVTGQLRVGTADGDRIPPTSLAVAIGWAPTADDAAAAVEALDAEARGQTGLELTGRLISDEGPVLPGEDDDPQTMTRMSPAALLGQWSDVDGLDVYRQYLVADETAGGLTEISSPAPEAGSTVNWLNIFYAAEWAIFAGFAFYLWYRLAKDAWEKEVEDVEDAAAEAS